MSVRSITAEEVAFFHEKGWAHLPNLVDKAICAQLLKDAEAAHAQRRVSGEFGDIVDRSFASYSTKRQEPYASTVLLSPTMGTNIARLLDVPQVRLENDVLLLKLPENSGKHDGTLYHQDFPGHPFDRSNFLTIWVALHDMPAEAGTMRFYEGSHHKGVFGQAYADGICLSKRVKSLREQDLSPPLGLKAGDATAHHCLTVHGTPPNLSNASRWGCAMLYTDADARYSGNAALLKSGVQLDYMAKFEHPAYPLMPQG
jgi:ectoine hydroxylase-related dioxygenase (phytanoyl-CoA dioxygenase family)